jgi:hypothetical protein
MYKSSPFTFVFKFIFPVFMLAGVIFGIYMSWIEGTPESQGFAKAMITITVWISIFLVQMPFRLKHNTWYSACGFQRFAKVCGS